MACYPGTPCFNSGTVVYPTGCGIDPCYLHKTGTDLVFYNGANLPCVGVDTCDSVTLSFQKIDQKLCPDALTLSVFGSITNNLSIHNMFCALVDECIPTTTTTTTLPPCNCYNLQYGTLGGPLVTYDYVNCLGISQVGYIGDINNNYNLCAQVESIVSLSPITITDIGSCTQECTSTTTTTTTIAPFTCNSCVTYLLVNNTVALTQYSYADCYGVAHNDINLEVNQALQICVCGGNITVAPGVIASPIGVGCNPIAGTTTTTTTIPG